MHPAHEGIKSSTVTQGACWMTVVGEPDPVRIQAGDCFLLARGRPSLVRPI